MIRLFTSHLKLACALLSTLSLTACYKDTQTCKCARQRKFDFKDACKNVEQMEPIPNVGAGIRWYTGVERFSPCYNPNNTNEIAFCLVIHDNGPKTRVVIADLQTGKHRLVSDIEWSNHKSSVEWGRGGGLLFLGRKNWMVYDVESKYQDSIPNTTPLKLSTSRWDANGSKIISWIYLLPGHELESYLEGHEMASMSWPGFKIEPIRYFRSNHLPSIGQLAISQNGDFCYVQLIKRTKGENEFVSKWISKSFQDSGLLYSSQPKIGYLGEDYKWHPNQNDVYFANVDDGIFFISKGGNKQYRIKKGCPNRHYEKITISPLGDKLIAQRRDIEDDGSGGYVSENTKLVMMDIDGCNEEVLFEDWDGVIQ